MRHYFSKETKLDEAEAVSAIKQWAYPMEYHIHIDPLMERIGDARIVMLGEASHGTSEYYSWRSYITQRLIQEKGFNFIAVEGDWPDCYRLNRYIKNYPDAGKNAIDVLREFNRWPTWMWPIGRSLRWPNGCSNSTKRFPVIKRSASMVWMYIVCGNPWIP